MGKSRVGLIDEGTGSHGCRPIKVVRNKGRVPDFNRLHTSCEVSFGGPAMVVIKNATMATYYVICITKKPSHADPYTAIQSYGVSTNASATVADETWTQADMISVIEENRHTVKCMGKKLGSTVLEFPELEVVSRGDSKYVKSTNDGDEPDNLLARRPCP